MSDANVAPRAVDTGMAPVPANAHTGNRLRWRGLHATTMLTIYVVLLCAVPSNLAIAGVGAFARPSVVWGLLLALWWVVYQLQQVTRPYSSPPQLIRIALGSFLVIALVSFAVALLRGQPYDQVTPAIAGILRLVSWIGVALVAMDGIRTMHDLRALLTRLTFVTAAVAGLGLIQTFTRTSWIDLVTFPGLTASEAGGIQDRGGFIRAVGTATHPLEYAMLLAMCIPFALALAASPGSVESVWRRAALWCSAGILGIAILLSASRSALLGLASALLITFPALPKRVRRLLLVGIVILIVVVMAVRPGLLGTMRDMFLGISSDPSAQSRTGGLERAPGFIAASPFIGVGYGTFLSRYYIFDNEWVLLTIELGIIGIIVFGSVLATAGWVAWRARKFSSSADVRILGQALLASCVTGALLMTGFDGLSFPISGGVLFLTIGLCGAIWSIGVADGRTFGPLGAVPSLRDERPDDVESRIAGRPARSI